MYRLVIVEDEDLLRMGLTTCIDWAKEGYELVGETGDGEKGLALVLDTQPDVLITDIKMPRVTGLEMTEHLKKIMPNLKVVIISGYDDFDYAKRALRAGVSEYILKPINIGNLLETMKKLRDELTSEREKQAEYLELKSAKQKDLRLKRADLYRQVLLYQTDMTALAEDRKTLGGFVENRFYAVGLASIPEFSELYLDSDYSLVMEKDKELGRLLEHLLNLELSGTEYADLEILRPTRGERLICVTGESREETNLLVQKIKDAAEAASANREMALSFGTVLRNLEGLQSSYSRARKLHEQKFMKDWQDAVDVSIISEQLAHCISNLCMEIRSGSTKDVKAAIEELKGEFLKQNIASFLHLTLIMSSVYYTLIKIPLEVGGNISDIIGNPQVYHQKLLGLMHRDEMLAEIEDLCLKLHYYSKDQSVDRKQEIMRRIDTYLSDHFSDMNLAMKDVADYTYVSVSYLGMIIRQETGKTFVEYLTDIRVERAKQFLANTEMKNYEIAEACGYSTPAYFSTVFKGIVGMTPSEYRNFEKKKKAKGS